MLFLDIETQNDWTKGDSFSIKDMRISYVGVIDNKGKEYDFWEDDIEALGKLLDSGKTVVHYNGFTFDMPIIANYVGEEILEVPQIDLMVALRKTIGFRPKLDDVASATLGRGKIGKGSDAVKYWNNKDLDSLKKYCLRDVLITKQLYEYGEDHGSVKYYDKGGFLVSTNIDWSLGERVVDSEEDEGLSMF